MKRIWKLTFAAFTIVAFTACNQDTTTETESVETTEEMDTELDSSMDQDTVMLQDTTVNDGVADELQEEQPPVQ